MGHTAIWGFPVSLLSQGLGCVKAQKLALTLKRSGHIQDCGQQDEVERFPHNLDIIQPAIYYFLPLFSLSENDKRHEHVAVQNCGHMEIKIEKVW